MKRKLLYLLATMVIFLACSSAPAAVSIVIPTQTATPQATQTATSQPLVTITAGTVNVRNSAHVATGEYVRAGDVFPGTCSGEWCEIGRGRFVWQGCTDQRTVKQWCR